MMPPVQEHSPLQMNTGSNYPETIRERRSLVSPKSKEFHEHACQSTHPCPSSSGNGCGCGVSTSAHVLSPIRRHSSEDVVQSLMERVKRLEETVVQEREIRDSILLRERQAWEREVRVLREALASSYRSEHDTRRRLLEVEDRVEANYNEQIRLRDKLEVIDDTGMSLEDRLERLGNDRSKRRKIRHESKQGDSTCPDATDRQRPDHHPSVPRRHTTDSAQPRSMEDSSRSQPDSPRSSGILNLVTVPRPQRLPRAHANPWRRPLSPVTEDEPRSSGFLALDIAKRLGCATVETGGPQEPGSPEQQDNDDSCQSPAEVQTPPPGIVPPGPLSLPALLSSNGFVHASKVNGKSPPTRHQHANGLMALDVLANVSAANTPVR